MDKRTKSFRDFLCGIGENKYRAYPVVCSSKSARTLNLRAYNRQFFSFDDESELTAVTSVVCHSRKSGRMRSEGELDYHHVHRKYFLMPNGHVIKVA